MDDNTRIVLVKLLDTIREFKAEISAGGATTTLSIIYKAELMELIRLLASP